MRESHRPFGPIKAGLCGILGIGLAATVRAEDTIGPDAGIVLERIQSERRVVLAYLAHDNGDLALTALDRWRSVLRTRGAEFVTGACGRSRLKPILEALDASLAEAATAVEQADSARAITIVHAATGPLDAWRHEGGLVLFSDCIADLSGRYSALDQYRRAGPDLEIAAARAAVSSAAADAAAAMSRCDARAHGTVRSDPEFRRLADGMSGSLAKVQTAVDARDPALLHRLLIELRAFEQLLIFRYG